MIAPGVSVLMTAFNRERYVAAAIESVLAQTFSDFELVVIDDGSTDGTVAIARRYLSDHRVRVVVNDRNLGDYPNRNHAVRLARGEFFKFHDSDDVMYPHCLEVLVRCLAAEPRAAFALSGSRDWPGAPAPLLSTPALSYAREYLGSGMFHLGPACALFRRDLFQQLGGFPEGGVHSDLMFWLRACARVNVLLTPGDLFWYRVHGGQELQRGGGYAFADLEALRWRALSDRDCPLSGSDLERAKRNQAGGILKRALGDIRAREFRLAVYRLRHSGLTGADWLRYARRPRRHAEAGSVPRDAEAEKRPSRLIA